MAESGIQSNGKGFLNGNPPHQQERADKMNDYILRNLRTNEIITLKNRNLTAEQMKEINRDGFTIIAIK